MQIQSPSKKDENYRHFDFKSFLGKPVEDNLLARRELPVSFQNDYFCNQNLLTLEGKKEIFNLDASEDWHVIEQDCSKSPYRRLNVFVEKGIHTKLFIHRFTSQPSLEPNTNELLQINVAEGACLELCILQNYSKETSHVTRIHAKIQANASLISTCIETGGQKGQLRFEPECVGEKARSKHRSLFYGQGNSFFDLWIHARNLANHTLSEADHWVILKDGAESVFNGNLIIPQGVLHSDGYQKNQNLMLSDQAVVHAAPKLEIETDEVSCAHGASISSIDPDQIFYLMSRGLSQSEAETMLVSGFKFPSLESIDGIAKSKVLEALGESENEHD